MVLDGLLELVEEIGTESILVDQISNDVSNDFAAWFVPLQN